MHLKRPCVYRVSDASQCTFISVSTSACVYMSVFACVCLCEGAKAGACEGGFICFCSWLQPLIHGSGKMTNPLKSEGRQERKGQTNREREAEQE